MEIWLRLFLEGKVRDCEMSYKELEDIISSEDSETIKAMRHDIIMQYENIAFIDYIEE